jgi:pyridoxamine 5'-phosphate oxidase
MTKHLSLSEDGIDLSPFVQFEIWYKEHLASDILIPNTVSLATASRQGHVSIRTILLKEYNESGFIFFTNYNSRKGSDLSLNPKAAFLFYWVDEGRQIRIEGVADKISEDESDLYFKQRPRESQIAAWASEQSSLIPDRLYLEKRYDLYNNKYIGKQVERPRHWGGFRLVPYWFEFWQERDFRLHDRLTYTKRGDGWIIGRLAP